MPVTVNFELDLSQVNEAIRRYYNESSKTLPEIVNRAALVAIIGGRGVSGCMQRTRKAERSAILAVNVKKVARYVMSRHKGEKLTRKQMHQLIKREYRRRLSAIGYTAYLGWNKAAIAFGGRGLRKGATGHGRFQFGSGTPADSGQWPEFKAEMVNAAPAAAIIGEQPLQDALNDAARDMIEYTENRMQETVNTI